MIALKQISHVFSSIPFNKTLGLIFDSVENDHILMHFDMRDELVGNFVQGILHGGVISSVLDMAGGAAAMIAHIQKHPGHDLLQISEHLGKAGTINIHVDYLRPGKGKRFFAKAWILRSGNKITVSRMELTNDENSLIATATGTYMVG